MHLYTVTFAAANLDEANVLVRQVLGNLNVAYQGGRFGWESFPGPREDAELLARSLREQGIDAEIIRLGP